ncbi:DETOXIFICATION 14-like protein [Tanacetum coccineum]|uniref:DETOXIFICATION 14-like protein n=1 Tax=Tanacetum coccineum TaxID=301880 RepID=A0ABQ5GI09_9ASTR
MMSLQSQSLIRPLLVSSILALSLHIRLCWALVFKLKMGSIGAAISFKLCNLFCLKLVVFYVKLSTLSENTFSSFSNDTLCGIEKFFSFSVPSTVMFEMVHGLLISELLPNQKLETSVLSICLTMSTEQFTILYGLGAAASTQVSKVIGAGNPQAARVVVRVVMFLAIIKAIIASMLLLSFHHFHGTIHSDEKPASCELCCISDSFISLSIITDSLEAVKSGIASGGGWQHIGAYVTLGAIYLFGIPCFLLGFLLHLKTKGLCIGILIGSIIQFTSISVITGLTDLRAQDFFL